MSKKLDVQKNNDNCSLVSLVNDVILDDEWNEDFEGVWDEEIPCISEKIQSIESFDEINHIKVML